MSSGGLIGAIVGGVAGFFIGGPMGAIYGASLGFGAGMMLDPMTPDMQSTGSPAPQETVMKSTVGDPCVDVCGSSKITGHLLAYGNERSVAIYSQGSSGGGKGGPPEPQPQVTGYTYYMTWQLGICRGPIDTLHAIYKNGELVWEGPLAFPASGGKETITVDGLGSIDFYFGADDQVANSYVAGIIDDTTINSPLRNFCWAVMVDCKIGEYPRTPTLEFVVTKQPVVPFGSTAIQDYDCNPMAAVWYVLNTLCGLPVSWLNETVFGSSAYTLGREYRGISVQFKDHQSALTYIHSILDHAYAVLRYDSEGAFTPILIREDYDTDTIPVLEEDDLQDELEFTRKDWIDTSNEIKVQFSEIINVDRGRVFYGTVYWFGINGYYCNVHDGNTLDRAYEAEKVPNIEDWKVSKIENTMGVGTSFLFRDDGLVFSRGGDNDGFGLCGHNNFDLRPPWAQPTMGKDIPGFWSSFSTGAFISFGLTPAGKLYACGRNGGSAQLLNTNYAGDYLNDFREDLSGALFADVCSIYGSGAGAKLGIANQSFVNDIMPIPYITSNVCGGGGNAYGELGYGYVTPLSPPPPGWWGVVSGAVGSAFKVLGGNAMGYYCVGTADNFVVYGSGINSNGRLGRGFFSSTELLWGLVLGGPWKDFNCSVAHAVAIKTDGTLWGCGENNYYQLGQGSGDSANKHTMTQIGADTDWVKVVANYGTTYALKANGEVWCCGRNLDGTGGVSGGGTYLYELTRESTNGIWYDITAHQGGLWLIK